MRSNSLQNIVKNKVGTNVGTNFTKKASQNTLKGFFCGATRD